MRNSLIILLISFRTAACNSNPSQEQLNDFENQLTAEGIFWQSEYGNRVDFLFKKSGEVIVLLNGRPDSKMYGKWSFDK